MPHADPLHGLVIWHRVGRCYQQINRISPHQDDFCTEYVVECGAADFRDEDKSIVDWTAASIISLSLALTTGSERCHVTWTTRAVTIGRQWRHWVIRYHRPDKTSPLGGATRIQKSSRFALVCWLDHVNRPSPFRFKIQQVYKHIL